MRSHSHTLPSDPKAGKARCPKAEGPKSWPHQSSSKSLSLAGSQPGPVQVKARCGKTHWSRSPCLQSNSKCYDLVPIVGQVLQQWIRSQQASGSCPDRLKWQLQGVLNGRLELSRLLSALNDISLDERIQGSAWNACFYCKLFELSLSC